MRLLDRYLLRELLVPLAYCLGGFLMFYIAFDLVGSMRDFQDKHMRFGDCVEYYIVTAPELLVTILPVALLLALLYALTNHARNNELTAMRAAGVSLWRLALPYFAVGLVFTTLLFLLNETCVPQAQEKSEQILDRRKSKGKDPAWHANLKFLNDADNRSWTVKNFNIKTGEMLGPTIIWQLPDGSHRDIYAQRGVYSNSVWTFFNGEEWRRSGQSRFPVSSNFTELTVDFPETPELIRSEIKINNLTVTQAAKKPQLSIAEISNYLRLHPRLNPEQRAMLHTQWHGRLAEPWECLMVVLIAIPFGARSGRRNVFVGVAVSIFICFGYFVLQRCSLALGTASYWPPALAAWLPNVLFGAAGVIFTLRFR